MIFDGPVNKAKIHVLQDIYAIQLTDTLFLFQNHKLKNHIDLNNFFDEFEYDSLALLTGPSKIIVFNNSLFFSIE